MPQPHRPQIIQLIKPFLLTHLNTLNLDPHQTIVTISTTSLPMSNATYGTKNSTQTPKDLEKKIPRFQDHPHRYSSFQAFQAFQALHLVFVHNVVVIGGYRPDHHHNHPRYPQFHPQSQSPTPTPTPSPPSAIGSFP